MPIIQGNTGPTSSTHAIVVVPSDTVDLLTTTKGIWVGGAGNVKVTMFGREEVVFTAIPAGTFLRISVSRIWATSTTAANIVALWE